MTWDEYEDSTLNYLQAKFHNSKVTKNVKILGKLSNTNRQIDVLIETQVADIYLPIVVECKRWASKLDVADVGSFIDKLNDVGITRGMMISRNGYSQAAYQRAISEKDINLHILDFEGMASFQGFWGNPYRGNCGAILSAPTGWVVDANLTPEERLSIGLCWLYPMGLNPKKGMENKQIMYFNLFPIQEDVDAIIKMQNDVVIQRDAKAIIEMWQENFSIGETSMRKIYYSIEDYTEYSSIVSSDKFYAYCIIASKNNEVNENLARLRYVMNNIHFIVLDNVDPTNSHEAWKRLFPIV